MPEEPLAADNLSSDGTWSAMPPAVINLKWRPTKSPAIPSNVLVVTDTSGALMVWDVNHNDCNMVAKVVDDGNELIALDFTHDGERIVTSGKNRYLRIHDLELREVATITGTSATINDNRIMSHTNRVTQLCCHPRSSDLVVTSSWDTTVQLWDLRCSDAPVRVFDGVFSSSGSPIDVSTSGEWLVAGNGANLEFYDVGSGRQLYTTEKYGSSLVWPDNPTGEFVGASLELPMNFVQFSKDPGSSLVLTAGGHIDNPCAFVMRRPDLHNPEPFVGPGLVYGGLPVTAHLTAVNGRKQLFRAFDTSALRSKVVAAYGASDGSVIVTHV